MRLCDVALLALLFCACVPCYAQDSSLYSKLYGMPDKLFSRIDNKAKDLEHRLEKQTQRYLNRLEKREKKLQQRLWKKDSVAAKALFGDVTDRYNKLKQTGANTKNIYSSHLDSMQTALRFLQTQSGVNLAPALDTKYQSALNNYTQLQGKLNQATAIKQYLKERQQYLKGQLQKFGLIKEFRKFEKDVYYYRAQVDEYKYILDDPSKLEAKLLQLANKIPAFKDFFAKNSMLSSMFRVPGNDPVASATPIPGLQTRSSVQQNMIQRFGSGPDASRAMQQNIQSAQSQVNQLKDKISKLGGGDSDMDMPDFKPNSQKVKSFWNRIELGANMQNARSNSLFPVTSDFGLSAGYKLNDKSIAGIGVSYKLGWGQNISNIKLTHEGVGLRSFVDIKLKGSFYASGGFEYNYQKPFGSVRQLYGIDNWQQSGLIGVSKVIAVQSKIFKKTKVQLLWDFLSYQQIPRTQPVKFRVGYNF
jgi:hypothetical protein